MFEKYFLRLPTAQDEESVFDLMIRCISVMLAFPIQTGRFGA
jgi:hypothetical protein